MAGKEVKKVNRLVDLQQKLITGGEDDEKSNDDIVKWANMPAGSNFGSGGKDRSRSYSDRRSDNC